MDDEVLVQMTYDEEEDNEEVESEIEENRRNVAICVEKTESVSGIQVNGDMYYGSQTIHLDGDKTMNENSMQMVSFFSVADDLLLKGNFLTGQEVRKNKAFYASSSGTGSSVIIADKSSVASSRPSH
jgi:hypothetical protein